MFWDIALFICISVVFYFAFAALMVMSGKPAETHSRQGNLDFRELRAASPEIPRLKSFTARDGKELAYRHYPAKSRKVMILLHGSGWHSRYLHPLARFISHEGLAEVFTPDLRGHGLSPDRRGDVDYIGQLEDDLADFIAFILAEDFGRTLILGGHSSGGGLALRFAGSPYRAMVDAYKLMSPFLKYNAPTMRRNSGGWANPHIRPIIGLTMLNNVGIRRLNYLPVIDFNMPVEVRDGTETLTYSFRLNTSYAPSNYKKDLQRITKPLFVAVGTEDEAFFADRFAPLISRLSKGEVRLLEGVSHMGVVVDPAIHSPVREWIMGL